MRRHILTTVLLLAIVCGAAVRNVRVAEFESDIGAFTTITMEEDAWIGIGASSERIIFDGTGDVIQVADSALTFSGTSKISGLKLNIVAKAAAYTASATDDVITCGAGNESFTVSLLAPSSGKVLFIKNVGTGVITVDADTIGSTTIDGDTTQPVGPYECLQVICDDSVYWAI